MTGRTSFDVRADLEHLLERDLLGPWDGEAEELPPGTSPAEQYLLGRLVPTTPAAAPAAPGFDDPGTVDREVALTDDPDDTDVEPEATVRAGSMAASSLGLSFSVPAGVDTVRATASWGRYEIGDTFSSANEGLKGRSVYDIAKERGRENFDTLLDVVIEDELRTVLWPLPPDDDPDSWKLRADAWRHPLVLIGGSDAGAHLDRMCGAPYTTAFLADTLRGRKLVSLEDAVHMITQAPAELFGLRDRGVVREGSHADLVLFDTATVGTDEVRLVEDLPGGTARLFAGSRGIERVFVNGRPIVTAGATTGELPGTVLRSGRDTRTVPVPAGA